jgi:hypothetical protein
MSQQRRSRFSPTQMTDVWRRWKAGQSLHDIGRAYGKPHPSIRCVLLPPPLPPIPSSREFQRNAFASFTPFHETNRQ